MTPVSFEEAQRHNARLVELVLAKLRDHDESLAPTDVQWFVMECHDDPEQPLDEAACADVMLRGTLPTRHGIAGRAGGHFSCFCEEGSMSCGQPVGGGH